jgi:LemA protein
MNNKLWLWGGVAIVVLIVLWCFSSYNSLVSLNEQINGQWAQVENQYQRRLDLIPNLVSSVQGIMTQEKTIFEDLAAARSRYAGATTVNDKAAAASQVESSLGRLLAIVESYPQLKSSEAVQTLMAQLEGTENRVSTERGRYNDVVRVYDTQIKTFPAALVAGIFGFGPRNYFEAASGAEVAPKVNL